MVDIRQKLIDACADARDQGEEIPHWLDALEDEAIAARPFANDAPAGFVGHPLDRILAAVQREFPTGNSRLVSGDSVAITDADGDDWLLILKGADD